MKHPLDACASQKIKDLEFLRHVILNNNVKIRFHERQIEMLCKQSIEATHEFEMAWNGKREN